MLRDDGPRDRNRRRRSILTEEEQLEAAADAAVRQFLRRVLRTVTPQALTAAVEPPVQLFSLGEAYGWWEDAVDEHVVAAVQRAWQAGYGDTRDGELLTSSRRGMDDFIANVTDRLSSDATPTLPRQAMDIAREALSDELARGSDMRTVSRRLAAEFSWDEDATFWRGRLDELDGQADRILDRYGAPGDPVREAVRTGAQPDEQLIRIQNERARAVKHIDEVESTWQVRAERIARTESTAAYNAGSIQAGHDEGAGVKIWMSTADDRTRDDHLEASGQCVDVSEPFTVGGDILVMPADPAAPAEQTVNCRCTIVFARDCEDGSRRFGDIDEMMAREQERRDEAREAREQERRDR